MKDALILVFDAPLIAFGGVMVDQEGVTNRFPAISMITGLLANALGWDHSQGIALNQLQERIHFAARLDRAGEPLMDYQTVDLGQEFLVDTGWTTRGKVEKRAGASSKGTHIRHRHYWADAVCTLAITLDPMDKTPTLEHLITALTSPARPLFIGRKHCLPTEPIFRNRVAAVSLKSALEGVRPHWKQKNAVVESFSACWPSDDCEAEGDRHRLLPISDERDWINQIHGGRRLVREGVIRLLGEE